VGKEQRYLCTVIAFSQSAALWDTVMVLIHLLHILVVKHQFISGICI